jgi:hypothetical protein
MFLEFDKVIEYLGMPWVCLGYVWWLSCLDRGRENGLQQNITKYFLFDKWVHILVLKICNLLPVNSGRTQEIFLDEKKSVVGLTQIVFETEYVNCYDHYLLINI